VARRERILFLCTAGVDRSPTAADLYADDPRYEVRAAGLAPFAREPVDQELVAWADRIFVMDETRERHRTLLRVRFPALRREIVDLDVEDRWRRGHAELVRLLRRRLRPHLGSPKTPEPPARKLGGGWRRGGDSNPR
jgi:predicted protein tyrosine phosphatase